MLVEQRTQHPFHMYEAILAQPDAFAQTIRHNDKAIDRLAALIASYKRLFIVGIGTSYHAAQVGEHFMRVYGGELFTQGVHAFDFALSGPNLTSKDCVIGISHRGNKLYTLDSLRRAREAGCCTAMITGEGTKIVQADFTISTVPQEKSSAHTVSYVGSLAVLASLAERIGYHQNGRRILPTSFLLEELPRVLHTALTTEGDVALLAREHLNRRRFWLVGGGPSAITAYEIALKIKETSYLQAEGSSIEMMLHGSLQCAEAADLFILVAPAGAAQRRVVELAGLLKEIGTAFLIISDGTYPLIQPASAGWCTVPPVPEPFTALTCLVPLQLFAYYLALERRTNPDSFRLDDPRFARARALVRL